MTKIDIKRLIILNLKRAKNKRDLIVKRSIEKDVKMGNHITPKVGVGVWAFNEEGQICLLKRISSKDHGDGCWSLPGGHVEIGEDPKESAVREVLEETGLDVDVIGNWYIPWTNDIFNLPDKHYITLFLYAIVKGGQLEIKEPNKCSEIGWFDKYSIPQPLFPPLDKLVAEVNFEKFFDTSSSSAIKKYNER
jgi:8-oxo-dGTP diphosphatase